MTQKAQDTMFNKQSNPAHRKHHNDESNKQIPIIKSASPAVNQDLSSDPRRHRLVAAVAASAGTTMIHAEATTSDFRKAKKVCYSKPRSKIQDDGTDTEVSAPMIGCSITPAKIVASTAASAVVPVPAWRRILNISTSGATGPLMSTKMEPRNEPSSHVTFKLVNTEIMTDPLEVVHGAVGTVDYRSIPYNAGTDGEFGVAQNTSIVMPDFKTSNTSEVNLEQQRTQCHDSICPHITGEIAQNSPNVQTNFPLPTSILGQMPNRPVLDEVRIGDTIMINGRKRLALPPLPAPPRGVDLDFLHRTSPETLSVDGQLKWLEQAISRVTYFSELYHYRDRVRKSYLQRFL
ncbi:uncharacterized protein LOC129593515 isoform X2 [Paramacrobiotus metropolitanus]|nr:uncharacterized protein LOC129593515 isoform X2 [Paramacrobiotus metropolitanus]XP_055345842.1 uncharacterized protein LOC129593515 isoform X2 [Paramacrobiotus metropolitanus]